MMSLKVFLHARAGVDSNLAVTSMEVEMNLFTKKAQNLIAKFGKNEDGVTAIEYALIAALIAVVIIAGATLLGTNLNAIFAALAGLIGSHTP